MRVFGPYSSEGNAEIEELRIHGPATIDHRMLVRDDAQINGPCGVSGTLESGGNLRVRGPVSVREGTVAAGGIKISGPLILEGGVIKSLSGIDVLGPVTNDGGTVECDELDIRGPLKTTGEGRIIADDVCVHGPLTSDTPLSFADIKVFGPLKCGGSVKGRSIEISGSVDVDGSLAATEGVAIDLGWCGYSDTSLIDCEFIQAPEIRISGGGSDAGVDGALDKVLGSEKRDPSTLTSILAGAAKTVLNAMLLRRRIERPFIDVDLRGERVVLSNVHHVGKVEGELILKNEAVHED